MFGEGEVVMGEYYVVQNVGGANFVKGAEFFVEQGGLTDEWGEKWVLVQADSIKEAREICKTLFDGKGNRVSLSEGDLSPHDKGEVDTFKRWLAEDPKVRSLAQSFAILSDEDRERVLEWAGYLDGDASALSVESMGPFRFITRSDF
jgi:hypothetical protein